jgi:hypothetical protein
MQTRTTTLDIWTYPEASWSTLDLAGYDVEALDGSIGDVDDDTAVGSGHLVVSTGPLIFGRKVMLPAGVISSIDPTQRKVRVNLTKDVIKDAPELDEDRYSDPAYQQELGRYYEQTRPVGRHL